MKTTRLLNDSKGVAMVVVIVVIIMLTLIGSFMANYSYNQQRIVTVSSGRNIVLQYRAQAGIVDANWRIRTNYGTNFTVAGNTASYSLDVDGDGVNDTNVVIGAADAAGVRQIDATGLDV